MGGGKVLVKAAYDYIIVSSVEEALDCLNKLDNSRIIAGGTDLVLEIEKGIRAPAVLIDVNRIPELRTISCADDKLVIGCAAPFGEIANNPVAIQQFNALAEACASVGSPQIRNRGTIGGNFGTASAAADSICPITAFEPEIRIYDRQGSRSITVGQLWEKDLISQAGRSIILGSLIFDCSPKPWKSVFVKLGRREALSIARLSLTVAVKEKGGTVAQARVAIGSAGRHPYRSQLCEESLTGKSLAKLDVEEFGSACGEVVKQVLKDRPTAPYKIRAVRGMAAEAIERLIAN